MKIIVGLSGGVDSAVAALLLKQQGHEVAGLFMKNWEEDDTAGRCSAAEDLEMVRAVCGALDIPLQTVNFSAEYWDRVFQYFLDEHKAGRTPNPDVLCNKEIKFRCFLEHALTLGAERIATGHYAQVRETNGQYQLLKGADPAKDQSYFLYALDQRALGRTLFPVGALAKRAVRELARRAGLPNAERRDSTGICFIGERDFRAFLQRFLPARPGEIRGHDGRCLGRHEGVMYYTIGQRHGLGIGGPGEAWYVAGKDVATNTLYVVQGARHPALYGDVLAATELSWVAGRAPVLPLACTVRIRYRQDDQACTIEALGTTRVQVRFDAPQRAIAPGQSVVFYRGELCLGGGVIECRERAAAAA